MFQTIAKTLITLLLIVVVFLIVMMFNYFVIVTFVDKYKNKDKKLIEVIKTHRYIKSVDFIKWVIIDFLRGKDRLRLYGIWCFTGYFGEGKTLGAVHFANSLKEQYPQHDIKLFANFEMVGAEKISKWQDLLDLPPNSIVIFDEIQSTFTSTKFNAFPIELLWKITQCRKKKLAVFCSTPVFHRMSIQLRENCNFIITCKNFAQMDRYFVYDFYKAPEYERYMENPIKLLMSKEFRYSFVAHDTDYAKYNTEQIVDRFDIEEEEPKKAISISQYKKIKDELMKEVDVKLSVIKSMIK